MTEWHIEDVTDTLATSLVQTLMALTEQGWHIVSVFPRPGTCPHVRTYTRIVARREVAGPLPRPH
jgi:hypothetical protein